MSKLTWSSEFSTECNTKTQRVDIGGQLAAGSRYFDIRPLISALSSEYLTNHFSEENIDLELKDLGISVKVSLSYFKRL